MYTDQTSSTSHANAAQLNSVDNAKPRCSTRMSVTENEDMPDVLNRCGRRLAGEAGATRKSPDTSSEARKQKLRSQRQSLLPAPAAQNTAIQLVR